MGTITITGVLRDANNNPLPNRTINLYIEIYNNQGQLVETRNVNITTDSNGNYSYSFTRTMYYDWGIDVYVSFAGDNTYKPSSTYGTGICSKSQCC